MKRIKLEWRNGFPHRGVKVEVAAKELNTIRRESGGTLAPAVIVEAARKKTSPLHPLFEWDDTEAARLFRANQARELTRSVIEVVVKHDGAEPIRVRAFISVPTDTATDEEDDDGGHVYVRTSDAMKNASQRDYVVGRALSELRGWQARWGVYRELADVAQGIDALIGMKEEEKSAA